jgi:uncharacterized membrane protein
MDERIRASDADRDHVTTRLREHFAAGRLTSDELDERIAAALNAKTHGQLRALMADLPEPALAAPKATQRPYPAAPPWVVRRRGPRFLPVVLLLLLAALLLPGGHWLFFGVFQVLLVFWLLAFLGGIFAMSRAHHHRQRMTPSGTPCRWTGSRFRRGY